MKGNRNDGMGLEHAASCLQGLWTDLITSYDKGLYDTYWDREIRRIVSQMRKRARKEKVRK